MDLTEGGDGRNLHSGQEMPIKALKLNSKSSMKSDISIRTQTPSRDNESNSTQNAAKTNAAMPWGAADFFFFLDGEVPAPFSCKSWEQNLSSCPAQPAIMGFHVSERETPNPNVQIWRSHATVKGQDDCHIWEEELQGSQISHLRRLRHVEGKRTRPFVDSPMTS